MEERFDHWVDRQIQQGFGILVTPWEHGVTISQVQLNSTGGIQVLVTVGDRTVEKAYAKLRQEIEVPYTHAKKPELEPHPEAKKPDSNAGA